MQTSKLNEIGLKYQCDKSTMHHGYLPFYQMLFDNLGFYQPSLLEVGVQFGCSAKMWREYLGPKATIVGIDSFDNGEVSKEGLSRFILGDAYTHTMIANLATYNIVIDDGSHTPADQQFVAANYSKLISPSGILIIEDVPGLDGVPDLAKSLPPGFFYATIDLRTAEVNTHDSILFLAWRK